MESTHTHERWDAYVWGVTNMPKKSTTAAREKSSGNVFADLGLPHPEQKLLKARPYQKLHRPGKELPMA